MQTSLKRNLLIGFSISMVILIASSAASFVSIRNLLQSSDLVEHSNKVVIDLNETLSLMKDAETGQRGFLLSGNEIFLQPYNGTLAKVNNKVEKIKEQTKDNPKIQQSLVDLGQMVDKRFTMLQFLINEKRAGKPIPEATLMEGKNNMDSARRLIAGMVYQETTLLNARTERLNRFSSFTPIMIVAAAFLALLITVLFYVKLRKDISDKIALQEELQAKDIETAERIKVIDSIANKISSGQYEVRVSDTESDNLGSLSASLNKMAESLDISFKKLSKSEWLQSGIAKLNESVIGDEQMELVTEKILTFIAGYTGSLVGAIYLKVEDGLILENSFALGSKVRQNFSMGEGLVGECAVMQKDMLLSDLNDDSFNISFASAELKPVSVFIFPVFFERQLKAVVELGALHNYTDREIQYLKDVSQSIGTIINTVQNRQNVQMLLEQTQQQAEELMTQHKELENMNAELEAQSEELQASEEELKVQQEELLETNSILEERSSLLEDRTMQVQQKNREIEKKMEELALSTRYKSEFLANMSHELRTPLNSILLLSRLMAENNEKNLSPDQVQYAQVIQSSGNGLLELIDEILDLSKIESGKMTVEIEPVNTGDIVNDIRRLFDPIAQQKNIGWEVNVDANVPAQFETDRMRLEQILKNLLSNAFKFTQQGQVQLTVSVPADQPASLCFTVKDSGIGIAQEKQQLIFEAFQQEDGSTRRKYGGTGLGLSISRELSKLLGGRITLKSETGKGSEFSVCIPVSKGIALADKPAPVAEIKPAAVPEPEQQPKETVDNYTAINIPPEIPDDRDAIVPGDNVILLIEDDTAFAKALLDYTRKKGYKGIVAVRGDTGIEMANRYNPTGILLDIQLPVKNGWQVMEELKKNPATRHIPVHIMSSFQVKKQSMLQGAVDFINKPVAFEQLNTVFDKLEFVLSKQEKKVLIVEDNFKHAKALAYFLGTNKVNTSINHTVDESISALQNKEVDCVILDMGVPDLKAYELLESVKQNKGLEDIPIIIFTGRSLSQPEEFRIRQYADSIVLKTAHSYQRILDEVSIFLHLMEGKNLPGTRIGDGGGLMENVLRNKKVLLADDDVRNIFSMTKALEKHNMTVIPAMDGKEALALLEKDPVVDIILMDMMMPEMDGYETIKAIRNDRKLKNIPVIAVTAKAMTGDREKCIAAGASDYISKPVDIDQLVSLLRIWLYEKGY